MKKLSVFQTTLLAIFGACAVAGVLIFAIATGSSKSTTAGAVLIWGTMSGTAFTGVLQKAINTYPSLAQVTYVEKDPATFSSDLTEALAAGTGPDLFLISQDEAIENSSKAVLFPYASISATLFQNTFIKAADPFMLPSGIVALPIVGDPMVLYWNKDLLASAGYAQAPSYWEELFGMASKLTQRTDAGGITKSAIALGEYQNVTNAKDILSLLILQAGGTITSYSSGGRLDSTFSKAGINSSEPATETALRFYTQFSDPSKTAYSWNRSHPHSQQDFAQGNLALYIGYASEMPIIRKENPNLSFGIAGLPQIKSTNSASHTTYFSRVYGLAIARTSRNIVGAQTVASILAQAPNSAAFALALGVSSVRRDVLSQDSSGDQSLFNSSAIASYGWSDPNHTETAKLFQAMIENTTSGATLVGDAAGRGDAKMSQIINGQ